MDSFISFHANSGSKRHFGDDEEAKTIFGRILKEQLSDQSWMSSASDDDKLLIFRCLRVLLRDQRMLNELRSTAALTVLCEDFLVSTKRFFSQTGREESQVLPSILEELTNILQKLSDDSLTCVTLIELDCHTQLMGLLSSDNQLIFHSSIIALINISKTETGRKAVLSLNPLYTVVDIVSSHDNHSQLLAGDLLLLLSLDSSSQQEIKDFDLLPDCIVLIQSATLSEDVKKKVLKALQKILVEEELMEEFRIHGGIPILVKAISFGNGVPANSAFLHSCLQLLSALCIYDPCAKQIVECNGIYHISRHLTIGKTSNEQRKLNADVFRTLRYLFSLESNRRPLKRLFPTHIFEAFIDVGHYVYSLDAYSHLCQMLETLSPDEENALKVNISSLDQNKEPIGSVGGYSVLEVLGSGAYGIVYKVRKAGKAGSLYAMKEIKNTHPALGGAKSQRERAESAERIVSEVAMTHQNLSHSNIVRYHKCFQDSQNIYIVMNLIDGAPLSEHITSLKEKHQKFSEDRIWTIFTQVVLGLRYLHEEKRIVHRDVKPANIMLGEKDKVTITDFGLAKQQKEFSLLKSVVGTMLYWCPELVQNEEYDKKADIWAAGCVLYEMGALTPPFMSSNMLILAKKISEGDYDPKPLEIYTEQLGNVVKRCLCLDPTQRPDCIQVGSVIVDHIMNYLDRKTAMCDTVERKLSREREKRLRHKQELLSSELRQCSASSSLKSRRRLRFSSCQSSTSMLVHMSQLSPLIKENKSDEAIDQGESILSDSVFQDQPVTPPTHYLLRTSGHHMSTKVAEDCEVSVSEAIDSRRRSYSLSPIPAKRSTSGSSVLSISSSHLKEIADPIGTLMNQIHKLVYVCQLPLGANPSPCHLTALQYKKNLFADSLQLSRFKSEIQKLASSSTQQVILFRISPRLLSQAVSELRDSTVTNYAGTDDPTNDGILTYELLHAFIEDVLETKDYYRRKSKENC